MKLQEFMNDDTCQILFAIIIGIVVCYFIFGSCGNGCSRRDGFSVGATCDTYFDEMITNCDDGDGNLTEADLNPDLITDRCAQTVNSYTMARTQCVLDQLGSIDRLSVQDPQLTTELRQSIDRVIPRYNATSCESRASSPATCGSRTVGVGPLPPLRVNCEINAEGDACIAVPAPPAPAPPVAPPVAPPGGGTGSTGATGCGNYSTALTTNCSREDADGNTIIDATEINGNTISPNCLTALMSYQVPGSPNFCDINNSNDFPSGNTQFSDAVGEIRVRRNGPPCEARVGRGACVSNPSTFPIGERCEHDSSDDACTSVDVSGGVDPGIAPTLTDPDTVEISLGPAVAPAELLLRNIKRDVEYQISRITGEDPPVEFTSIDEARTHVQSLVPAIANFLDFRILVNDKNLDGNPNSDKTYLENNPLGTFQIDNVTMPRYEASRGGCMAEFYNNNYIDTEYNPNDDTTEGTQYRHGGKVKMNLTNITDTYSSMTPNNKKEIYCNNYTLQSESGVEYIDPLLKLISPDMMDRGTENITCPDSVPSLDPSIKNYAFEPTANINKNQLIIQIRNAIGVIREIDVRGRFGYEAFGQRQVTSPIYDGRKQTEYNESLYLDDLDTKKRQNDIAINIHTDGKINPIPPPIVIRTHNGFSGANSMLIGLNGLSNNRDGGILRNSPYNNNTVIDTNNGAGDKYSSDNNAYQIYLKNVFWLQYYFARMFMGTDRYIPFNNYRQMFDPPINLITDTNGDIKYADSTPFPDFGRSEMVALDNQSCRDSGTDYLLLTILPASLYDNALTMSNSDVNKFLGGQDSSRNSGESGVREIANGLFIVDGIFKKIIEPEQFNRVINPVVAAPAAAAPTSQITLNALYELNDDDVLRYIPGGINDRRACTPEYPHPYTLVGTGPTDPTTRPFDDCHFCLADFCADNSKVPEIISRLTPVAPACSTATRKYVIKTGCELLRVRGDGDGKSWDDFNWKWGDYDHKNCDEFVSDTDGTTNGIGGYTCEDGSRDGGVGQCQNGPMCTGSLPTATGKEDL